ncbi:MAG: hypothetical protein JWP87_2992 [Labilithrix sp.]|nr:hypothetical protein [Labilithrix sp.]
MKRPLAIACLLLAACSKSSPPAPAAADDAAVRTTPSTSASTNADAGATAAAAPAGKASSFAGKYTVTAGTMYVPEHKDWSSVKFKNDDSKMLGDGEISIAIDPSGRVSGGTEAGPLGASLIDGTSDGTTLTGTIRRKDPTDDGLTGTLVAKIAGDAIDGTMNLAESNAAVVRVAKLVAKKK